MEYTAHNLEYAVSVFYNGEQEERAKAHAWLTTAQRVPEAWNFVWELLQPSKVIFCMHFTNRNDYLNLTRFSVRQIAHRLLSQLVTKFFFLVIR